MKQKIVLSALFYLLFIVPAFAQRAIVASDAGKGRLEVANVNNEKIDAKFSLTAGYPDNLVLQIAPSQDFTLNAHIINAGGVEVAKIPSQAVSGRYANSIDISKLKAGDYFVEVLSSGDAKPYRIPFTVGTKSAQTDAK